MGDDDGGRGKVSREERGGCFDVVGGLMFHGAAQFQEADGAKTFCGRGCTRNTRMPRVQPRAQGCTSQLSMAIEDTEHDIGER